MIAAALVFVAVVLVAAFDHMGGRNDGLERRVSSLEAQPAALSPVLDRRVKALEVRVDTLEATPAPRSSSGESDGLRQALQRLQRRIAALEEARVSQAPAAPAPAPTQQTRSPARAATATTASAAIADPDGGALEQSGVRRALAAFGFTFLDSPLADGTPRVIAKKETTVVELFGYFYVTEMAVTGVASGEADDDVNATILVGMGAVLGASTTWGTELVQRHHQGHDPPGGTTTSRGDG